MSHFTLDQMLEKSRAVNAVERLEQAEGLLRLTLDRDEDTEIRVRAFLAARRSLDEQ